MRRVPAPRFARLLTLLAAAALAPLPAVAQERPNLMIVFDASGSMWGQIGGRSKIELARQALSSVLSEADANMDIGMIAYGHRVRGQCSDIEMVVPSGPAAQTVPQILAFANRVNPRGMTPLADSVLIAAQRLGYTEQAATVVLLTDGIETCGGDPCALGRLLAREGIDFRAHVVGFDLTDAEQRQVSCLAEETGGMFLAANDADELRDALARTLSADPMPEPEPQPEPQPEPAALPRRVDLILRDVEGGPALTRRALNLVMFEALDDAMPEPGAPDLDWNQGAVSGRVELAPGRYQMRISRSTEGRQTIRVSLPVEIPDGTGPYTLDLVIAARLQLNALLHAGQPMPARSGRLPAIEGQGWSMFEIHPVIDGAIDPSIDYGGFNSRDVALPPGDYFVRGSFERHFARERLVTAAAGVTTSVDFDLGAAPVTVDLRDPQGFPVEAFDLRVYDLDAPEPFVSGSARSGNALIPVYLPEGHWRIEAIARRGDRRPAEAFVTVTPGQPVALQLAPGARGNPSEVPETATAQCIDTHRTHGCVVEAVTPLEMARHLALNGRALGAQVAPRYTGTWQTVGGMMALVQDGRRVWGEVHVNGGIGLVWGHVAPDGLTLRGAMDRSSNPRGVMELRIDAHADTLVGFWDHNIGRAGQSVAARRLSGGVPPLTRATGTDDDLRLTMRGEPWATADSAEFAAYMDPALAPASPDTGDDIDAMQQFATPPGFHGVWNTSSGRMELVVDGRDVRGQHRGNRPLVAEISADGSRLRGIWMHENGRDLGTLALDLDAARMAFTGSWGRNLDPDLRGGAWTGTRIGWLAQEPALAVTPPSAATGPDFDAFMDPVRDPDLPAPDDPDDRADAGMDTPGWPDLIPYGLAGFTPALRFDYAHPDGRPAASFAFAEAVEGGADGPSWTGYAWLMDGWCGSGCAAQILPIGGSSADEVPNAPERLDKGGVFPALDLSSLGILAFDADGSDWRNVTLSVVVMDRPYSEGEQLGQGDARVTRRFGPFTGGIVQPATLDGWPQPDPDAGPVPDVLPPIGMIDVLPESGIFAAMADRPGEGLTQAFDRLFSGAEDARMAMDCTQTPWVLHPDGLMAERELDSASAQAGGPAYRTTSYQRCEHSGPIVECRVFRGQPTATEGAPRFDYRAEVVRGPDGSFALRDPDTGRAMMYRECRGSGGFLGELDRWPDGRLIVATMFQREDQDAPAPMPAPTPAPVSAAGGDTLRLPPGIWHVQAPWSDPMPAPGTPAYADRCFDEVSVTWPDGVTLGFTGVETDAGPDYEAIWAEECRPSGDPAWPLACTADDANVATAGAATTTSRMRIDAIGPDRVELMLQTQYDPAPGRFVLLACTVPGGLDLTGDPRGRALARAISQARPGAPSPLASASPAPTPAGKPVAPAPAPVPATDLRPGIAGVWFAIRDGRRLSDWTADEVAEACYEAPARFHPDGLAMLFLTRDGVPQADSHLRCDAGLSCDYARGSPSQGQPVRGQARLSPLSDHEIDACLGSDCSILARCPAPDWSARERASGLAERWEAGLEVRD